MTLFDAYLVADWSASSTPKTGPDSVWFALGVRRDGRFAVEVLVNPPTRARATECVAARLAVLQAERLRVFVGFDFAYGYPAGLVEALTGEVHGAAWHTMWIQLAATIHDDPSNGNNRFKVASELNAMVSASPGPFWGCPPSKMTATLRSTSCGFPYRVRDGVSLERLRITEERLPRVQEAWKLSGAGSVGSQSLMGIPRVLSLRDDGRLACTSSVWPFETGFTERPTSEAGPSILHAEIWPGIATVDVTLHAVKDAAQVLSLIRHLAELDEMGRLGRLFSRPNNLSNDQIRACLAEEGWILGA